MTLILFRLDLLICSTIIPNLISDGHLSSYATVDIPTIAYITSYDKEYKLIKPMYVT